MKGEAADIQVSDMAKLKEWFTWLMDNTDFDQLILEHASKNRLSGGFTSLADQTAHRTAGRSFRDL